jgi:hypothetical protein
MSGSRTIDKIRKRSKWPVKLDDETTVYIRTMVKGEQRASKEITDDELRGYFIFGVILLEDDGTPSFTRNDGETVAEFAARVAAEMDDVPQDHQMKILDALTKASNVPESIPKN